MVKLWKGLLICLLICLLGVQAAAEEPVRSFSDVPQEAWYADAVAFVAVNGIMNGTGDDTFDPAGSVSRGMFVTMLGRFEGIHPAQYSGSDFKDVAVNAWHAPYIAWAVEQGLVTGYGNGSFGPQDDVTREQMAVIFVRYLRGKGFTPQRTQPDEAAFTDAAQVSAYAKDAVTLLQQAGVLQGDAQGKYSPRQTVSRAEAATMFMRMTQTPLEPLEQAAVEPSTVFGSVTNEAGEVLAAVEIHVSDADSGQLRVETMTVADGRYVLKLLPGEYRVDFALAGYQTLHAALTIDKAGRTIVLPEPVVLKKNDGTQADTYVFEGYVTDEAGAPVPGATVELFFELNPACNTSVFTNDNGFYRYECDLSAFSDDGVDWYGVTVGHLLYFGEQPTVWNEVVKGQTENAVDVTLDFGTKQAQTTTRGTAQQQAKVVLEQAETALDALAKQVEAELQQLETRTSEALALTNVTVTPTYNMSGQKPPDALTEAAAEWIRDQLRAREAATRENLWNWGHTAKDIVDTCWTNIEKLLEEETAEITVKLNGRTTTFRLNYDSWLGHLEATDASKKTYTYIVCSLDQMKSAMQDYLDALDVLAEEAIQDAKQAVVSDLFSLLRVDDAYEALYGLLKVKTIGDYVDSDLLESLLDDLLWFQTFREDIYDTLQKISKGQTEPEDMGEMLDDFCKDLRDWMAQDVQTPAYKQFVEACTKLLNLLAGV